MDVPVAVFRKYDIRGAVAGTNPQMTPQLAHLVGKGYATYMQRTYGTDRVFVGSDNRHTSPPLKSALIDGILSAGIDVTDIGEVMTPTVYFASAEYGPKAGGIQITGSHLSLEYNGIKMAYDRFALYGDQIQAILKIIQTDDFAQVQARSPKTPRLSKSTWKLSPAKFTWGAANSKSCWMPATA